MRMGETFKFEGRFYRRAKKTLKDNSQNTSSQYLAGVRREVSWTASCTERQAVASKGAT